MAVYKPIGWTSQDVVARLKTILAEGIAADPENIKYMTNERVSCMCMWLYVSVRVCMYEQRQGHDRRAGDFPLGAHTHVHVQERICANLLTRPVVCVSVCSVV
jgi:hypothetical protein